MTALFTRRDIVRALGGAAALAGLGSVISSFSGTTAALVLGDPAAPRGPADKPGTVHWVARHDLTDADYRAEFKRLSVDGAYRLADVCGYDVGGQARYGAIWEKRVGLPDTPDYHSEHAIRLADYQARFNERKAAGDERPVRINGYNVGGQAFFATIWEKAPGPDWFTRHEIPEGELKGEFQRLEVTGYRLVDVCGYVEPRFGGIHFATIWELSDGRNWGWIPPSTRAEYQTHFEAARAKGYRPVRISGFTGGGEPRFTAVLEKDHGIPWQVRHGISGQLYQHEFDHVFRQPSDHRPAFVGGFTSKDGDRFVQQFSPVWEKRDAAPVIADRAAAYLRNYAVPGLSLAIAKDGKLVHAGAYGLADRDSGAQVSTNSLFRIASVAKPITAVACFRLVEAGKLTLADKVFGTGGILGTTYGSQENYEEDYTAKLQAITVQHLLEHTAGGWTNIAPDPMFEKPEFDHAQLISWVLDKAQLGNPGAMSQYSNFGYCLLGRIIEKVSGQTYAAYVQENVLRPCGITDMHIAGDTLAQRRPNEVVYYDQAGEDPYGIPVARMDSHGGWVANATDLVRFAVRVDGLPTTPDILTSASIATMTTKTTAPGRPRQAKAWQVDDLSWDHNGDLPGTVSTLVRTNDGFCWAALINTRRLVPDNKSTIGGLERLMWKIRNDVDNWPAGQDL